MRAKSSISVLIADPSAIVATGLTQIAQSTGLFTSINEYDGVCDLMQSIKKNSPQLILLNPTLFVDNITDYLKSNATTRMVAILYTPFDAQTLSHFHDTILLADSNQKIIEKLAKTIGKPIPKPALIQENELSTREVDVLRLLVTGLSSKEISEKLFISTHTVITHRKNITRKLNIRSVSGLTVYAIVNGIVTMDEIS